MKGESHEGMTTSSTPCLNTDESTFYLDNFQVSRENKKEEEKFKQTPAHHHHHH